MENKIKRFLSFTLALLMIITMMPQLSFGASAASTRTIYLNAGGSSLWDQADAWFAVHAWSGDNYEDVKMTKDSTTGYYKASINSAYTDLLFVRLNPSYTEFSWEGKWNQTGDLTVSGNNNLFTIEGWDYGSWSHQHIPGAAATCNTAQTCTVCGDTLADATGNHTYEYECSTTCKLCGGGEREVADSDHSWFNGDDIEADGSWDCTQEREQVSTCLNCNADKTETIPGNTSHYYENGKCFHCGMEEPVVEESVPELTEELLTDTWLIDWNCDSCDSSVGTFGDEDGVTYGDVTKNEDGTYTVVFTIVTESHIASACHGINNDHPNYNHTFENVPETVTVTATWNAETKEWDVTPIVYYATCTKIETTLSGSGTEADPYLIKTVDDLIFFRNSVNAGETKYNASGVYVALGADINLAGTDWSVNIGDDCNATFDGIFDGKGYTISNLTATETAQKSDGYVCSGLFGAIYGSAVIKNLTIENVTINTGDYTGNNVGAVVGFAYSCTGSVENVTVTGNIKINASGISGVGGIVGYDYYGKLTVKNCSVIGNDGSAITGAAYVGGVIGYASSNSTLSSNTVQNVTVSGKCCVGGVAGLALGGTTATGNTVKNTTLSASHENWQNSVAVVVGTISGGAVTVSDTTTENVTGAVAMVGSEWVSQPTEPVGAVAAAIGNTYYTTLQKAFDAVQDGETITLLSDITIDESTRYDSGDGWYEGVYYEGDKSFTIDLGGYKLTNDSSVNDYLMLFKNVGSQANEITIKNGTVEAASSAYCAICTSGGSTQIITVNLENVNVIGNNSWGSVVKVRAGTVLNVKSGAVITGNDSYLAIENVKSTTNIYDGAKLYMNGTGGNLGLLVGTCYGGTVNVYGGYGEGDMGVFIAMTSGGTIDVSGGEWIANGDGTVGENSNYYVLTAQNNMNESGYVGASIINVTGGTFRGGMDAWILNDATVEKAELNITGGFFSVNPSNYVEDGYEVITSMDEDLTIIGYEVKFVPVIITYVATVTNSDGISTGYETLAEAIAAAQDGDTVTIMAGEYDPINISNKNITIAGTVGENGELLTTIKGGNPAITGHNFNGTIKDLKIVDAWKVMYAEPAGNVTVDNIYVTGATYGLHLVAYSESLTWTIQNSYMDLSWANSFGASGGDAAIVIKGNEFDSTNPYYADYGALPVNTFLPNVTVQNNVFGENTKIRLSVSDTSAVTVSANYHADGVDNAFASDSGATVYIYEYYADENMTNLVKRYAQIGENYYATLAEAAAAAKSGDEIILLGDVTEDVTLPDGVIFNGNGHTVNGTVKADGALTIKGHVKATTFTANGKTITIGEGATLEQTSGRMVIGHGATFNITGSIENAKTADAASITPSLIAPGASFTGAGVTFNVTNAYVKFTNYCSTKTGVASGTFNFNITNSIWEQSSKLAFDAPDSGKDPTVNFYLTNSVLNTGTHLVFAVSKGEIVFDNSNVNVGNYRQLENRSTLTIKNGSVVWASVATSSNAINPGKTIIEDATYVATGDFTGSSVGTGTLQVNKGASFTATKITNANIIIDATGMAAGDTVSVNATLSGLTGTLSVINNEDLYAQIIDGKIWLVAYTAKIGEIGYKTFEEALAAASAMSGDVTVTILDKVTLNSSLSGSYDSITFVGGSNTAEIYLDVQGYITAAGKDVSFEDLTLSKAQGGFITNAGFMNVAFGIYNVDSVTYTNCVFTNGAYASSGEVTFTGCTFYRSWDKYGLWAYGDADITVDGCTFADYRGIKMYAENAAKTTALTVKNTDFSALTGKPAIVLTYGESVVLEGNTYSSTGTFELDQDGAPNGTPVTSDVAPVCVNDDGACGVLVDGKIYTSVADAVAVATAESEITVLYSTEEEAEFPYGATLTVAEGVSAPNVTVALPEAAIGETKYATLAEAVAAAANGDTIVLIADIEQTETVTINKTLTIDLNGHTITNATTATITIDGGDLTVKDSSEAQTGAIVASSTSTVNNDKAAILFTSNVGKFTLESGTLKSSKYGIRSVSSASVIEINGGAIDASSYGIIAYSDAVTFNGGKITSGVYGVAAYGTFTMNGGTIVAPCGYTSAGTWDETVAVFNGGTITSTDYEAIFWPSAGSLTINGGTFTGYSAVHIKSGSLSITGGTFIATGAKLTYGACDATGDALMIENIGGDSGHQAIESVEITGGTFKSTNASAVASYAATSANAVTGFIYGGTYSSAVDATYCALGYVPTSYVENGVTVYGVKAAVEAKIGNKGYATLAAAIAAAKEGDTILLQADVIVDTVIEISKNITIADYTTYSITTVDGGAFHITGSNALTLDEVIVNASVYADSNTAGATINGQTVNGVAGEMSTVVSDGETVTVTNPAWVADVNGTVYYTDLAAAVAAAVNGDTVNIYAGTYTLPALKEKQITVIGETNEDGTPAVILEGTLAGTLDNLTLKNVHIKGGNAMRWAYAKGDVTFENVTLEATSVYAIHFDGITEGANLLFKDCTIIGWVAMGGSPASFVFDGCTIKDNGSYGLIRSYFNTTITNCTFDVDGANTADAYPDGIQSVGTATITVTDCTNSNGDMIDLINVHKMSVVVLNGETIWNVATIGDTYYRDLHEALSAAQKGDTVLLLRDIDLNSEEWTPVDNFQATFDGQGYTISNLVVNGGSNNNQGLFGMTTDGEIKNLTIHNAKVSGRLNVGVVAGTPYTSKYSNIKVTGHVEVNGMAYVGGVGGKNAYADWTNITVDVDDSSYVKATSTENGTAYRTYVGGVIGFIGEGSHTFTNISSNIKVIGDVCDIGGLFGIAHYGNNFVNVTFTGSVEAPEGAEEVGGIAGVWNNTKGYNVSFTNVTSTGTVTVGDVTTTDSIVGGAYYPDNRSNSNSGGLYIDGKEVWLCVAKIGNNYYQTVAEALTAAADGDTIELIWAEGDAAISMAGQLSGKTVTITGTAKVNWEKGYLYVGRTTSGTAEDATLIFKHANITSAYAGDHGIHVSGAEANSSTKKNGTVKIIDSTVEISYVNNRNAMVLENSTLTVQRAFNSHGRPASESATGTNASAIVTMTNSTLNVLCSDPYQCLNLGGESIGIVNMDATSVLNAYKVNVETYGYLNINGGTVNATNIVNGGFVNVNAVNNDNSATVKVTNLVNNRVVNLYGNSTVQVEKLTHSVKEGYFNIRPYAVLNNSYIKGESAENINLYGDVTFNGGFECVYMQTSNTCTITIEEDTTVKATYGVNCSASCTLNGGTLEVSMGDTNWGLVFQNNTYVINSNIVVNGNGKTAPIYFTNAIATINGKITQTNSNGEPMYIGTNSVVTLGKTAEIDVLSIYGEGKLIIDATGMTAGEYANVKCSASGFTGTLEVINNADLYAQIINGKIWLVAYTAKISETGYATLQAAIDAAVDGDTITLMTDCDEDVTVVRKADVNVIIDGNGKTMSGTITIDGKSQTYETGSLTIQNFKFNATNINYDACIRLGNGTTATRYVTNVTVSDCTFEDSDMTAVGIKSYTGGDKNITVTGCTATGMHSLMQLYNTTGVTVSGCEITDSKNGISVRESVNVNISECEITITGYGIRADGKGGSMVVSDVTITAELPIVVRNTVSGYDLELSGTNVLNGSNENGYDVIFTAGDDGIYETPSVNVSMSGTEGLDVFPVYKAKVNDAHYMSLDAALSAAVSGDTVALLADAEKSSVLLINAGVTLDLNGHNLTVATLVSFGDIIDSADGVGLLKITTTQVVISDKNSYLPIYDSKDLGYRFFYYEFVFLGEKDNGTSKTYGLTIRFQNMDAYELIATGKSGLSISFNLEIQRPVTTDGVTTYKTVTYVMDYSNAGLVRWATNAETHYSNSANTGDWAMKMTVTGLDSLAEGTIVTMKPTMEVDVMKATISAKLPTASAAE